MNAQEIFNIAWAKMKAQDWKQSVEGEDGACQYRGAGGRVCAFGAIIPNNLYAPEMEGMSAEQVWAAYPKVRALLDPNTYQTDDTGRSFILDMQSAHDCVYETESMEDNFRNLALDYGLEVPS